MKIDKRTLIIAISTLVLGLIVGALIFGGSTTKEEEHQHLVENEEETIWTCSMHPQIRKNEPGDCPICGMELIPLESDENENDNPLALRMSPTAMQLANVSTAIVGSSGSSKTIQLNGKVQEDESNVSTQSSHIPGRIEQLSINFTGEYVNRGQSIAQIYSPELEVAQVELLEAYNIREQQPQLYNAAREKLKNWKLSTSQIDRIIQSGNKRETFPITADISGYVTEKLVDLGDYVQKGESLYKIADLSEVWVLFDIYETDLQWVNKGDEVTFSIASLPGEVFTEKISYIDPVIDPKTRVAQARVELKNKDMQLKPEMFVSGKVKAEQQSNTNNIIVPKSAVMWTGKRSLVYVKTVSDSAVYFQKREVTLGAELGEGYVIESGLQKGEEIAVHGTFSIDAAAQLAGKPSMMNPEGDVRTTAHQHASNTHAPLNPKIPNEALNKNVKPVLQELLYTYLDIKNALAADNLNQSKKAAKDMQEKHSAIEMAWFTGEAHNIWMKFNKSLQQNFPKIKNAQNIEQARDAFLEISIAMIGIVENFDPLDEKIYILRCPMADRNNGADWLSLSRQIRNPYFGEAMLTCGEVTKEID